MSVVDKYSNSDSSVTMILSHNNITKKIWYTPTVLGGKEIESICCSLLKKKYML